MPRIVPRPRTTVPLDATTDRTSTQLDHKSALGLAWAQRWLNEAHRLQEPRQPLKIPASGVIRRAVLLYVQHLEGLQRQEAQAAEVAQAHQACQINPASTHGTAGDPREQQAAWARLEGLPPGALLGGSFAAVYDRPGQAQQAQRVSDTAEALACEALTGEALALGQMRQEGSSSAGHAAG